MITEVLYYEVNDRFSEIYVKELDKNIFIETDSYLHNETIESRVDDIKMGWLFIDGEHVLLVVKFVLKDRPENIDDDEWNEMVENSNDLYCFKVLLKDGI